jgi:hypothetical protein
MTSTVATPFFVRDISAWPKVHFHLQRAPVDGKLDAMGNVVDEIQQFEDKFVALLTLAATGNATVGIAPTRLYLMLTIDGLVEATPAQIARAGGLVTRVKPYVERALAATAVVARNQAASFLVQTVMTFSPLQSEHKVFSNDVDGSLWLDTVQSRNERS